KVVGESVRESVTALSFGYFLSNTDSTWNRNAFGPAEGCSVFAAYSTWNFDSLNKLAFQMATIFPQAGVVPPPINPQTVLQNPRSHAIVKAKDEGNVCIP
ncbi:MAG TPA: hypothetical protein VGO47_03350, partial [Chlamydiales bacterium]|nr:hypothetical protein [Chlamydiales bacterium]